MIRKRGATPGRNGVPDSPLRNPSPRCAKSLSTAERRAADRCSRSPRGDEKLWLHDPATGVNHLIPHTGFYNELMRAARIRDAQRVFAPKLLFTEHARYGDAEILTAFARYSAAYNIFRTYTVSTASPPRRRSWMDRLIARK
ncbi:MAG: hypothetical protein IPP94_03865 [Ignavibacteria bacterium]|nr:hypothetical protein [Ignavibacteria bacterium]